MRDDARADVGKVWVCLAASLVLAAALTPWVHNCGMALAEVTAGKQTNGPLEAVAGWCRRSGMDGFFKVSWAMAAVVLCVPAAVWLGLGPRRDGSRRPRGGPLPDGGCRQEGQPLAGGWHGWRDGVKGAVLAMALVAVLGWVLVRAGALGWRGWGPGDAGGMRWLLAVALLGAVAQEVVFRGVVLGVFLRALRAPAAIVLAGLFFAMVVFLVLPGSGMVADPEGRWAGFMVLAWRCRDLADPWLLAGGLLPWLAFGCVLGFARWRTRSLGLPVGLHAGWVLGSGLFLPLVVPPHQPGPISRAWAGESLLQGLLPVAVVALAGMAHHFMTPVRNAGYERN